MKRLLGLVVTLMGLAAIVRAQDPPVLPDSIMSASLLKRLGSAVDGYRTGLPVWVVASIRFPNEVGGVFFSIAGADSAVLHFGEGFHRFGPYFAPPDSGTPTIMMALPCKGKRFDTSCPLTDSVPNDSFSIRPTPFTDVQSVTLTLLLKNGHSMRTTVPPDHAEAFFLTMSAVDRFLIPYYTQLYGVEYAAYLRKRYLHRFTRPAEE